MSNSKSAIKIFFEKHTAIKFITKVGIFSLLFLLIFDNILMPWYVSESEVEVPNLLNKSKIEAERILEDRNLGYYIAGLHKTDADRKSTSLKHSQRIRYSMPSSA